jgi:hypothetical protein
MKGSLADKEMQMARDYCEVWLPLGLALLPWVFIFIVIRVDKVLAYLCLLFAGSVWQYVPGGYAFCVVSVRERKRRSGDRLSASSRRKHMQTAVGNS